MEGKIANLVTEKLELEPEHFEGCFVYGVAIKARAQAGDKIDVFIDGDNGVNITQCARVNRYLQHIFDETPQKWFGERYTLDVSSPGIGQPIKFRRQYPKNIGRTLLLTLQDGMTMEGELTAVDDDALSIGREITRKDEKKKKNIKETIIVRVAYESISKAVVQLQF